jgi:hypothetical protein
LEFLLISFPIIVKANCCTCLRGRVLKWNRWHRQSQLQVCSLQNGINAIETNVYTYIQIPLSYIYVCIYICIEYMLDNVYILIGWGTFVRVFTMVDS